MPATDGQFKISPTTGKRVLDSLGRRLLFNGVADNCICDPCTPSCGWCQYGDPLHELSICSITATVSGWSNPGCKCTDPCTGSLYCADAGTVDGGPNCWHVNGTINGTFILQPCDPRTGCNYCGTEFQSVCQWNYLVVGVSQLWVTFSCCDPACIPAVYCDEIAPGHSILYGDTIGVSIKYVYGTGWYLSAGFCVSPGTPIGVVRGWVYEDFPGELACAESLVFSCLGVCGTSATITVSINYEVLCGFVEDPFWFYYSV